MKDILTFKDFSLVLDEETSAYYVKPTEGKTYKIKPESRTQQIVRVLDLRRELAERRMQVMKDLEFEREKYLNILHDNPLYKLFHTFGLM